MNVLDSVTEAFVSRLRTDTAGEGQIITVPTPLTNGNLVQIYVERVGDDRWLLSDEGQAASELALAGVNLATQKNAAASWLQLARGLNLMPAVLGETADVGQFDLAGVTDGDSLGRSILALAETVARGEALRVLAPGYRAKRFRDLIVQAANRRELPVVLDAPMPAKHGGTRPVSVKVVASSAVYLQAISGKSSQIDGFDKAQAVFSSAAVERDQLVAVLARSVHLEPWQWETLRDSGTPMPEENLNKYLDSLVA